MSRKHIVLTAALVLTAGLGAPAALAEPPACTKPGADAMHFAHEASEDVPVVGKRVSNRVHQAEERYCDL